MIKALNQALTAREGFNGLLAKVMGALESGQVSICSNLELSYFPLLVKRYLGVTLSESNFDNVACKLPRSFKDMLEVGCQVWPVFGEYASGQMLVNEKTGRGMIQFLSSTDGGRMWGKPIHGDYLFNAEQPILVCDTVEPNGARTCYDQFGNILPGYLYDYNVDGAEAYISWGADCFLYKYNPLTGNVGLHTFERKPISGKWCPEKQQVHCKFGGMKTPLVITIDGSIGSQDDVPIFHGLTAVRLVHFAQYFAKQTADITKAFKGTFGSGRQDQSVLEEVVDFVLTPPEKVEWEEQRPVA